MISLMRKITGLIGGALSTLFLATSAFAQQAVFSCPVNPAGAFSPLCNKDLGAIMSGFINLIFVVAILIALIWLIYGGIKWMVSGGDKSAVEEARNHVVSALIGLVIVFVAYFIINFLSQFLTGKSLQQLQVPQL